MKKKLYVIMYACNENRTHNLIATRHINVYNLTIICNMYYIETYDSPSGNPVACGALYEFEQSEFRFHF